VPDHGEIEMRKIQTVLFAAALACGAMTLVSAPVLAKAPSSVVKKCDKDGKPCTAGPNCKKLNCKEIKK
jgi:hypothetical protein